MMSSAATSTTTIEALGRYIAENGVPRVLASDNGSQFTSNEFTEFCIRNGIKHMRSPAFHPQSNGQAERSVDIFKRFVKKRAIECGPNLNLKRCVNEFLLIYRTTPSTATAGNVSPALAHRGHELRTTFELLRPPSFDNLGPDTKMEEQFNLQYGARPRYLEIGDHVYAKKQKKKPWFEGTVMRKIGKRMYEILDSNGKTHAMHINQMMKRPKVIPEDDSTSVASAPSIPNVSPSTSPRRSLSPANVSPQPPAPSPTPAASPPRTLQPLRRGNRQRKQTEFLRPNPNKKKYC